MSSQFYFSDSHGPRLKSQRYGESNYRSIGSMSFSRGIQSGTTSWIESMQFFPPRLHGRKPSNSTPFDPFGTAAPAFDPFGIGSVLGPGSQRGQKQLRSSSAGFWSCAILSTQYAVLGIQHSVLSTQRGDHKVETGTGPPGGHTIEPGIETSLEPLKHSLFGEYRSEGFALRDMLSLGAWRMGLGCSGDIPPPPPQYSVLRMKRSSQY